LGFDNLPIQYHRAFAFSLETCTTVGYGLPGGQMSFFHNCPGLQATICFQMMLSMLFNASLLAVIFARLSRVESRALQFLFSDKACIRREDNGRFCFEFQVYDYDSKYPILGAQIQLYAVHSSRSRGYIPMRTVQPSDDLNPPLLTSIPSTIIHQIDAYSPLLPPQFRDKYNLVSSNGLQLREIDSYVSARDLVPCPVCGCNFGTYKRLKSHIMNSRIMEEEDEWPIKGTHQELTEEDIKKLTLTPEMYDKEFTKEAMQKFWDDSKIEVVAMVQGMDPITSGAFQAIHSYNRENIVFAKSFVPVWTDGNRVNLGQFHETRDGNRRSSFICTK